MLKNSKSVEPKKAVLRGVQEVVSVEQYWHKAERPKVRKPPKNYKYTEELAHLQFELIKLQGMSPNAKAQGRRHLRRPRRSRERWCHQTHH